MKNAKILLAVTFATAIIAAPSASFAQTPDKALSTGGEQHNKEKMEMDQTREGARTPGSGTSSSGSSSGGSMSGSGSSGTAGYTDSNPAPPPNAQQNAPRPNN